MKTKPSTIALVAARVTTELLPRFVTSALTKMPTLLVTLLAIFYCQLESAIAQTTILSETFAGAFPGSWSVGDANASGTPAYWKNVNLSSFGAPPTRGSDTWACYVAGTGF